MSYIRNVVFIAIDYFLLCHPIGLNKVPFDPLNRVLGFNTKSVHKVSCFKILISKKP